MAEMEGFEPPRVVWTPTAFRGRLFKWYIDDYEGTTPSQIPDSTRIFSSSKGVEDSVKTVEGTESCPAKSQEYQGV